jgi:hypothetical protein
MLEKQEPLEEQFVGMSFSEPPGKPVGPHGCLVDLAPLDDSIIISYLDWPPHRPPMHHHHSFPFHGPGLHMPPMPPQPMPGMHWSPPMSALSEESDPPVFPPVPEPPRPWGPTSPTLSSGTFSSQQTWNSNSSSGVPAPQINHWAVRVFDGRHNSTEFRSRGEPTACYGRPEPPTCTERLGAEGFIEVLRLPLDAARVYVRLFWRPSDHRARILLSTKDPISLQTLKYCIPLTALKLRREGPSIKLFTYSTQEDALKIWAILNFTVYEQLVLFYCAFAAMKSQDWKKYPEVLNDRFHKRDRSEEKEEFSGEIKDDNYLHALRIYSDKDSGGIRLEARARRGPFTATPIWTAFITQLVDSEQWIRRVSPKVLQIGGLHPYVFCHGYTPPRGKSGKFRLQFTSQKGMFSTVLHYFSVLTYPDANAFIDMVNDLAV